MKRMKLEKTVWWAKHRHDIPIDGDWRGFDAVLHGGYARQSAIIRHHPELGLYSVLYVYPYLVRRRPTSQSCHSELPLESLASGGNLFDGYEGAEKLAVLGTINPTLTRCGYWIDWRDVDIGQITARWSGTIPSHARYWHIDNIPEWYRLLRGDKARFVEQVRLCCDLLRSISKMPIVGNVYGGGEWLEPFLEVADGASWEIWRWYWANGNPLPLSAQNAIQRRVEQALEHKEKFVVLHVPAMPSSQVKQALGWIEYMVGRYGLDRVYYYEWRPAAGTTSVRLVVKGLSAPTTPTIG